MTDAPTGRTQPRLSTGLREDARVTPLELFFDLVFVLALTQCTALMAADPTWTGLTRGLIILAAVWWSWVGYAWLTSVVDPEDGVVRLTIFVAMAAFLVVALSVPHAFGDTALTFACAYAIVRAAHIALFFLGSREDVALRQSVIGLAVSTAIGAGLLLVASATDGWVQGGLWVLAVVVDMAGPYLFGAEGWKLVPGHFAERHGLIVLIALGESIVAIGAGGTLDLGAGVILAAVLGMAVAAAVWWMYFDVVALVAERRLTNAAPGRERNEIARDSYSYLHFPMIAGIVLIALGMKKTLAHIDEPLAHVPATALYAGSAAYLLAHVAFRLRNIQTLNRQRLLVAVVLVALIPAAVRVDAIVALGGLATILVALIAYEALRFAEVRLRLRTRLLHEPSQD